jgi:hypothetical protein
MNAEARKSLFTLALIACLVSGWGAFAGNANAFLLGALCIAFGLAAFKLMPTPQDRDELRRAASRAEPPKPRMSIWLKLLLLVLLGPPAALVLFFGGWALLMALGAKP